MWSKLMSLGVLLSLTTIPAVAGLKDIRTEKLPRDQGVQNAYAEALAVEEFAHDWSDKWRYETPKSEVAARLKESLGALRKALDATPDNPELLLLAGLVAHYGYNVDVEETFEFAVSSFEKAQKLTPDDFRPDWFHAVHDCQSLQEKQGMERLLAIESRLAWDQVPVSFWDDYMACATVTLLPAHALRAADHAQKLNAPASQYRNILVEIAQKRFTAPDSAATYTARQVWDTEAGSWPTFTSTMCGLAFSSDARWRLNLPDVEKGTCVAVLETGPHRYSGRDVVPNILVLVRQAKPGETLDDFLKPQLKFSTPNPIAVGRCPASECRAFEMIVPKAYKQNGDGHVLVTAFKRNSPEYPGLLFEKPQALPSVEGKDKPTYFHPAERLHRLGGTLYYVVMLDTASSVLDEAKRDYEAFLKRMVVE